MRAVVIAIVFAGAEASADPDAEATRLFEEGRSLDEAGDADEACKKFEQSYQLDAAPGTALNLGACAETAREWRRAWELYDAAATKFMSKSDKRARFARARADRVLAEHPEVEEGWNPNTLFEDRDRRPLVPAAPVQREKRTGLKVATGASLALAAIGGVWWLTSYLTVSDYPQGAVTGIDGKALEVPGDCGYPILDLFDPNTDRFEEACASHDRIRWLAPTTIVAGALGAGLLIYLASTEPKPVKVVPVVSGDGAGVTATFEW